MFAPQSSSICKSTAVRQFNLAWVHPRILFLIFQVIRLLCCFWILLCWKWVVIYTIESEWTSLWGSWAEPPFCGVTLSAAEPQSSDACSWRVSFWSFPSKLTLPTLFCRCIPQPYIPFSFWWPQIFHQSTVSSRWRSPPTDACSECRWVGRHQQ